MSEDMQSQVSLVLVPTGLEFTPNAGEWETVVPSPIPAKAYIARNVDFCDDGASIIVYYCESHEMYVVRLFSNQISSSLTSSFPESVIQLNLGLLNGPAN
jgi:hypothetical protein